MREFNVEYIKKYCNELKLNKVSDFNFSVEHVLSHPIIYMHLKTLFDLIIKHGHIPVDFKRGVISPVIKDTSKEFDDITNYRPETIISVIAKLFEKYIYRLIFDNLNTFGLQLGFVKSGGCERAIFLLKNMVNYVLETKSDVYITTFDISSAFDRIKVYGLLTKLLNRNVFFTHLSFFILVVGLV